MLTSFDDYYRLASKEVKRKDYKTALNDAESALKKAQKAYEKAEKDSKKEEAKEDLVKVRKLISNIYEETDKIDDDYADNIAKSIVDAIYEVRGEIKSDDMNTVVVGSFVGATHPNIIFGKLTKATPDGRYEGDAFTMGITQSEGKDKDGLTALLNSIAKLDYRKFCGCIVSNIKMDKSMADSDEKLAKLSQMYYTFLQKGGMQLQINYLSQKELIAAQKNPEKYQNLVVRVTGYSGYFTRFDTDLQNDIIRRTVEKA